MKILCDKCWNIIDLGDHPEINLAPEVIPGTNNALIIKRIECNCDHCPNESADIIVDDELADIISMLNKKGYRTLGYCAGHKDQDEIYIVVEVSTRRWPLISETFDELAPFEVCYDAAHDTVRVGISAEYASLEEKEKLLKDLHGFVTTMEPYMSGIGSNIYRYTSWLERNPEYAILDRDIYHMEEEMSRAMVDGTF